jgi:hypothetical protein
MLRNDINQLLKQLFSPHRGIDVTALIAIGLDRQDLEIIAAHVPHSALPGIHMIGDGDGMVASR